MKDGEKGQSKGSEGNLGIRCGGWLTYELEARSELDL